MAQRMIFFPQRRRVNGKLLVFTLLFLLVGLFSFWMGTRFGAEHARALSAVPSFAVETVSAHA